MIDLNEERTKLYMKRPIDKEERIFEVYQTGTSDLNTRPKIEIIPHASELMARGM